MAAPATLRTFIAIELPPALCAQLSDVMTRLDMALPARAVRWVRAEGIHLTLKFLGDTPHSQLGPLQSIIASAAQIVAPFECSAGDLGCFPNARQPRVVWVGVRDPAGALERLQRAIEAGTARLGYPREAGERGFNPHLTLGRVGRDVHGPVAKQIGEIVQATKTGELGIVRVDRVNLMKSDLQAGGAIYARLYDAPLGSQAE
ncbi:MAG: RNA 2',3'-cyclic phosphodiesterase [Chloroflexi bacterium]|nr:RNA 2',3'-cyclic phosphodiesterase [Chloroflexota bacterium]